MGTKKQSDARRAYLANPNCCLHCGTPIMPKEGEKLKIAKGKHFCGLSCAAKFRVGKGIGGHRRMDHFGACEGCGSRVEYKRAPSGTITRRRFCQTCLLALKSRGRPLSERTKGELFANRKNWQSARSAIRNHAYRVFAESGRKLICEVCGYTKHAEIAHLRGVSGFSNEDTVAKINESTNLVALCPNCHWEFDHGLLELSGIGIEPIYPGL